MFNTRYKYKHGMIIYHVTFESLAKINDFIMRDKDDLEYFMILFNEKVKSTIKE